MTSLEDLRRQIDDIDDALVGLYLKRLAVCEQVADVKRQSMTNVRDTARENAVIERLTRGLDEEKTAAIKALYDTVFDTSRALQNKRLGKA